MVLNIILSPTDKENKHWWCFMFYVLTATAKDQTPVFVMPNRLLVLKSST